MEVKAQDQRRSCAECLPSRTELTGTSLGGWHRRVCARHSAPGWGQVSVSRAAWHSSALEHWSCWDKPPPLWAGALLCSRAAQHSLAQALLCSSIHPLPELFIYSFFLPSFFLLSFPCCCQMNSCFSSSSAGQGLVWLEHGCSRAGQWSDLLLEN